VVLDPRNSSALLQACQELLAGATPVGRPGEEEKLLRVLQGEQRSNRVEVRDPGHVRDAVAASGTRAGSTDAPVVEGNDPPLRADAIDDSGVPVSKTAARWVRKITGTPVFGPSSR